VRAPISHSRSLAPWHFELSPSPPPSHRPAAFTLQTDGTERELRIILRVPPVRFPGRRMLLKR